MDKQVATTNYAIEGDFISADEWSEDKFNKSEPDPISAEALRRARAANAMNGGLQQRQAMFNQGMAARGMADRSQGFNPGYSDSAIGSALGGGIFGWRK